MKEGEKPGKFLLPHGIILLGWWLRIFMEDNPYGIQNQSSSRIMELSVLIQLTGRLHNGVFLPRLERSEHLIAALADALQVILDFGKCDQRQEIVLVNALR